MYVDFGYYTDIYGGTILEEPDFAVAAGEAEGYIRYLTYLKGDIFAAIYAPRSYSSNLGIKVKTVSLTVPTFTPCAS